MAKPQSSPGEVQSVWTSDEGTMARDTSLNRWPKIIQGIIDDVRARLDEPGLDCGLEREGPGVLIALMKIRNDIKQDRPLSLIPNTGDSEVVDFNRRLINLGKSSWHACPWLYGECYLYRRVQSIFDESIYWRGYDVFKKQKDSTLAKSKAAVEELASRYGEVVATDGESLRDLDEAPAKILFVEMTELALWGNATDLSLLHNLSLEDIQKLQGKRAIEESQRNIVDNDTDEIWEYLRQPFPSTSDRRVDIVLDNAGFELFADILYAAYLLEASLASSIVLHAKCFPWFVSDVIPADVESLFEHLVSGSISSDRQALDATTSHIRKHFDSGAMSVTVHPFWTSAASFYEMPTAASDLFRSLCKSYLTIWKGDLNYRKLTKDGLWPHTTPFKTALGPLGSGSGLKILALRTNKSDTCVGVESELKVQALDEEAPNKAWVRNGKYAVISFSDGE